MSYHPTPERLSKHDLTCASVLTKTLRAPTSRARRDRDEEQHVQPPQPDGVEGEQVTGEDRVCVLTQKRAPAGDGALGCRPDGGSREDSAHQRRRNRDRELAQLAHDPHGALMTVLPRESPDQLPYLLVDGWPARPPVRVRPAAGDDPPLPAQQRLRRDEEHLATSDE